MLRAPFVLLPVEVEADLRARYAEPHRAYHDATHIAEVLGWFETLAELGSWERPADVYAAIWFHDAVYMPGAKDNEARSAELARAAGFGDRVAELILLTARHGALEPADVQDSDTALFLDADMAILGSERAAFDRYDAGIRKEYAMVPEAAYRAGRRAFLEGVLRKRRIFFSENFHQRLDAAARENLRRACEALR